MALDQELAQARTVHIELETTADAFRRLQKERQDTVAQWEQTLAAVSRWMRHCMFDACYSKHHIAWPNEVMLKSSAGSESRCGFICRHDNAIKTAADDFAEQKAHLKEKQLSLQGSLTALGEEHGRCKTVRPLSLSSFSRHLR